MKTILAITNCTSTLENFMKTFSINEAPLEEIISSRERNGVFLIKNQRTTDQMNSINVINIYITENDIDPLFHVSLNEEETKDLITDVINAKDLPYCELTVSLFKRQKIQKNDCKHCFVKCTKRKEPCIHNEAINAIFNAYCIEIYETHQEDYQKVKIAMAKNWPIKTNVANMKKVAMMEEELFNEFVMNEFHSFSIITPIVQKRCPQYLNYYFAHRKFPLIELIVDKYTKPW